MGEVQALGPGVDSVPVGRRVVPLGVSPGTWAELMVVPAARLLPVPDGVSDEAAAQLVVNPLSAWVLVVDELDLQPGEWLLQNAAGSTLGRVVIQLARARGFRTINVVRRAEQGEELLALGADEVIVTDHEDVEERVREITAGEGVGKAIDAVGGELAGRIAAALAPRERSSPTAACRGLRRCRLTHASRSSRARRFAASGSCAGSRRSRRRTWSGPSPPCSGSSPREWWTRRSRPATTSRTSARPSPTPSAPGARGRCCWSADARAVRRRARPPGG